MFNILESRMIVPNMHLLQIEAPAVAREAKAGQFVILRADADGERIPLSLSDWDAEKGSITVIFMNVGSTTDILANLKEGSEIPTAVGPLGMPTETEKYGTVVCIGGCYGIGSIYPIARALQANGNTVHTIIEGRSSYLLYWEDKLKSVSDKLHVITRDGTRGYRGHISRLGEILKKLEINADRIIVNGCTHLVKSSAEASRPLEIKTIVSLNPIMIDGTGMCGVCRVTVGKDTRFACVDGPDFDGHEVDWEELLQRRKTYMEEESIPLRSSRCEEHARQREQSV